MAACAAMACEHLHIPYWNGNASQHVVTVIGMTADSVLANDPAFVEHPLPLPYGDFDLAWLEMDEAFAVIAPA